MGQPIPLYEPLESGNNDNIFLSKSYDATSHFETTTGKPLNSTIDKVKLIQMQMISRIFTSVPKARSLLSRVLGRGRTSTLKSKSSKHE